MNKEFNKWWYRKLRIIGETALPTTVIHSVKDIAEAAWEASARRLVGRGCICGAYDHSYEVGQSKARENKDAG